jgi:hypothetical protein
MYGMSDSQPQRETKQSNMRKHRRMELRFSDPIDQRVFAVFDTVRVAGGAAA